MFRVINIEKATSVLFSGGICTHPIQINPSLITWFKCRDTILITRGCKIFRFNKAHVQNTTVVLLFQNFTNLASECGKYNSYSQ